jgi:hypothetical protein
MPAQWGGLGWGRGGCASLNVHEFSARSGQAGGRAGAPGVRWRAGKGGWMSHGERMVVGGESHCESGFASVCELGTAR